MKKKVLKRDLELTYRELEKEMARSSAINAEKEQLQREVDRLRREARPAIQDFIARDRKIIAGLYAAIKGEEIGRDMPHGFAEVLQAIGGLRSNYKALDGYYDQVKKLLDKEFMAPELIPHVVHSLITQLAEAHQVIQGKDLLIVQVEKEMRRCFSGGAHANHVIDVFMKLLSNPSEVTTCIPIDPQVEDLKIRLNNVIMRPAGRLPEDHDG